MRATFARMSVSNGWKNWLRPLSMRLLDGGRRRVIPVSYTHLDVYKRQVDGKPAAYGYGLGHEVIAGLDFTGHGGALRGFRAHRKTARAARLSVVVMFNHEADAHGAVESLVQAAMGRKTPDAAPLPDGWDGQWIGPNGLLTRLESGRTYADLHHLSLIHI